MFKMKMRPIHWKKGFTLTELQIASIILVIMLAAALSLYVYYWHTVAMGNNVLDVYSNSRMAMEWMAKDIRAAAQVVSSRGSYTTSDNCIVLQVSSINASGDIIGSHYDYIIYRLQNGNLFRVIDPDALSSRRSENRAVAHYCTSLVFSSQGLTLSHIINLSTINTVGIYLPLNKTMISLSGTENENLSIVPTTIVRMRNK